jgi:hypothetical protein
MRAIRLYSPGGIEDLQLEEIEEPRSVRDRCWCVSMLLRSHVASWSGPATGCRRSRLMSCRVSLSRTRMGSPLAMTSSRSYRSTATARRPNTRSCPRRRSGQNRVR